jgi:hypothetical protein
VRRRLQFGTDKLGYRDMLAEGRRDDPPQMR